MRTTWDGRQQLWISSMTGQDLHREDKDWARNPRLTSALIRGLRLLPLLHTSCMFSKVKTQKVPKPPQNFPPLTPAQAVPGPHPPGQLVAAMRDFRHLLLVFCFDQCIFRKGCADTGGEARPAKCNSGEQTPLQDRSFSSQCASVV